MLSGGGGFATPGSLSRMTCMKGQQWLLHIERNLGYSAIQVPLLEKRDALGTSHAAALVPRLHSMDLPGRRL